MKPKKAFFICLNQKKRIPEYEPIILTSIQFSFYYALYVIKGRWPEAEPRLKKSDYYWQCYCFYFKIKKDNKVNWKVGL